MGSAGETIRDFNLAHGNGTEERDVGFVTRLRARGFSEDDIAAVIEEIDAVCGHCWDRDKGCQCWNDE